MLPTSYEGPHKRSHSAFLVDHVLSDAGTGTFCDREGVMYSSIVCHIGDAIVWRYIRRFFYIGGVIPWRDRGIWPCLDLAQSTLTAILAKISPRQNYQLYSTRMQK